MNEKQCLEIVTNLANEYALQNRGQVAQEEGIITQDFLNRGSSGTTVYIAKALNPHIAYINNLINHIIEKLKTDFNNIPLNKFKNALCSLSEQEFRRISNVPSRLIMATNLHPVDQLSSQFQRELHIQAEKLRGIIQNKCAISKNMYDALPLKRRFFAYCTNHPLISFFVCVGVVVLAVLTFLSKIIDSLKSLFM